MKTIRDKIKQRIENEIKRRIADISDDELNDEVFSDALDAIDEYCELIIKQLVIHRVALGKRQESREVRKDQIDDQANIATVLLNLDQIEYPTNVELMAQHLIIVKPAVLEQALQKVPTDILQNIAEIIEDTLKDNNDGTE